MIIHDVEQGSEDWFKVRRGIPTASSFDKIITAGGQKSKSSVDYMDKLIAEFMTKETVSDFKGNAHTERGKELEPEAIQSYEMVMVAEVKRVGFVTNDAATFGCSPDGLLDGGGGLEIKCPASHNHVYYMRTDKLADEYKVQTQGNMFVTGRSWWHTMSYHPKMKPLIIRTERDTPFLMKMSSYLNEFTIEMANEIQALVKKGYIDPEILSGSPLDPGKNIFAG